MDGRRRKQQAAGKDFIQLLSSHRQHLTNGKRSRQLVVSTKNMSSNKTFLQIFLLQLIFSFISASANTDVTVKVFPRVAVTGGFAIQGSELQILTNRADFGSRSDVSGVLVHSPLSDIFLCDFFFNPNATFQEQPPITAETLVMLVPRGFCTFEQKARSAQDVYGAKGILIYDRLAARYHWDNDTQRVIFPRDERDYDCSFGSGKLQNLNLDPPAYNGTELDPLLDMRQQDTSICKLEAENGVTCESQLCLVTSHEENSTEFPVCCAWDVPFALDAAQGTDPKDTANIVAAFLTIRQSELLVRTELLGSSVTIESRGKYFNATYVFMWMLGTFVTALSAWYAAKEYRQFGVKIKAMEARQRRRRGTTIARRTSPSPPAEPLSEIHDATLEEGNRSSTSARDDVLHESGQILGESHNNNSSLRSTPSPRSKKTISKTKSEGRSGHEKSQEVWTLRSLPPPERSRRGTAANNSDSANTPAPQRQTAPGVMPSYEMQYWHVIIFIVVASLLLVLLFFFQFYGIVFILYGIGCGGAISYLIFNPLVVWLIPKLGGSWVQRFNVPRIWRYNGFDILSQSIAYLWCVLWIWYGWVHYQPEKNSFFWITTDIFGASFCVLTVSLLKLNSIKIAAILMVAVFVYDIFFVFITPYITGGDSVMLTVASGGGSGAEGFCDKYPDHKDCVGVNFIPMLFILPKVNDPLNGSVILGLGDVVLPGFLVAFCARYDAATRLVGTHATAFRIRVPSKWYQGFFFPICVAYSLGLLLAFMAVLLMQQGQPALLYICPILLGTIFYLGRKNLKQLWSGAEIFGLAERLMARNERLWERSQSRTESNGESQEQSLRDPGNGATSQAQTTPYPEQSIPVAVPCDSSTLPAAHDVYFRDQSRPGTQDFVQMIQRAAVEFEGEDYNPKIHKHVRAQLKGRRFFHRSSDSDQEWKEADKFVVRNEIGLAYDECRGKKSRFFKTIPKVTVE